MVPIPHGVPLSLAAHFAPGDPSAPLISLATDDFNAALKLVGERFSNLDELLVSAPLHTEEHRTFHRPGVAPHRLGRGGEAYRPLEDRDSADLLHSRGAGYPLKTLESF